MRVSNACAWVEERVRAERLCFAARVNDGEMIQMQHSRPEGAPLGTVENPATCRWDLGDALTATLQEALMAGPRPHVLLGHCYHDDPDDAGNRTFWSRFGPWLADGPEAGGHWPLEGACDGTLVPLLDALHEAGAVLVAGPKLTRARLLLDGLVQAPDADSWTGRDDVHATCRTLARLRPRQAFVWCAGAGLKPTAWRLWREFPGTTHVDLGHVFNGALGLRDYGWLQRRDGWWDRYFAPGGFADWFKKEVGM